MRAYFWGIWHAALSPQAPRVQEKGRGPQPASRQCAQPEEHASRIRHMGRQNFSASRRSRAPGDLQRKPPARRPRPAHEHAMHPRSGAPRQRARRPGSRSLLHLLIFSVHTRLSDGGMIVPTCRADIVRGSGCPSGAATSLCVRRAERTLLARRPGSFASVLYARLCQRVSPHLNHQRCTRIDSSPLSALFDPHTP